MDFTYKEVVPQKLSGYEIGPRTMYVEYDIREGASDSKVLGINVIATDAIVLIFRAVVRMM